MFKSILVSALLIGGVAFADDGAEQPTTVAVPLTNAYIPGGFDSNDRALMVVEGYFPNTCYRVGPYEKKLDAGAKDLSITQLAYKYRGPCLMMIVPFHQTVQVGILQADNYTVKDTANNSKVLGTLPVQIARNSGPDDHLYASINDAYVSVVDGNKRAIVMQGELPGDCWELKEKRVVLDGKSVITVLPMIEKVREESCNDYRVPFLTVIDVPQVESGRYLLHVRSLNGQAVNKLVDL